MCNCRWCQELAAETEPEELPDPLDVLDPPRAVTPRAVPIDHVWPEPPAPVAPRPRKRTSASDQSH